MTPELYTYLKDCWVKSNHTKYRFYFEEWIKKLRAKQKGLH
jgi:hypothetical protein